MVTVLPRFLTGRIIINVLLIAITYLGGVGTFNEFQTYHLALQAHVYFDGFRLENFTWGNFIENSDFTALPNGTFDQETANFQFRIAVFFALSGKLCLRLEWK